MRTNERIQKDVYDELRWDPEVHASDIGVTVTGDGVVTLTGKVPLYMDMFAAEKAAKRVTGVKAVAEDIVVEPKGHHKRGDTEIAEAVVNSLSSHVWVPKGIKAKVDYGWVTLTGNVNWSYQRKTAEKVVRGLAGVKGCHNEIKLRPAVNVANLRMKIKDAFERQADVDADGIKIDASDGDVVLSGKVHSSYEKNEASRLAWRAPGVTHVSNNLRVQ